MRTADSVAKDYNHYTLATRRPRGRADFAFCIRFFAPEVSQVPSGRIIAMPYLIDGHNLIPKLGLSLDSPDDEMQLVDIIQEFSRLSRHEAQIYFDGSPAGQPRTRKFGTVTAYFIRIGSSADAAIKARLQRLGRAAQNWTVVTSDHAVQAAARAAHASVLDSEDFARHLRRLRDAAQRPAGEPRLSAEEIQEWLEIFKKEK